MKKANEYRDAQSNISVETWFNDMGWVPAETRVIPAIAAFKSGFDCAMAYQAERVRSVRTMTTNQRKQIERRIEMLNKRIVENPNKNMSFDKAELSAINTLVIVNDFLAEFRGTDE